MDGLRWWWFGVAIVGGARPRGAPPGPTVRPGPVGGRRARPRHPRGRPAPGAAVGVEQKLGRYPASPHCTAEFTTGPAVPVVRAAQAAFEELDHPGPFGGGGSSGVDGCSSEVMVADGVDPRPAYRRTLAAHGWAIESDAEDGSAPSAARRRSSSPRRTGCGRCGSARRLAERPLDEGESARAADRPRLPVVELLTPDLVARLREALLDADFTLRRRGRAARPGGARGAVPQRDDAGTARDRRRLPARDADPAVAAAGVPSTSPRPRPRCPGWSTRCASPGSWSGRSGSVRARVDVRPYASDDRDWWVVSDLTPGLDGSPNRVGPDHVLGISSASSSLAQLTVRAAGGHRARPRHRLRRPVPAPRRARRDRRRDRRQPRGRSR